MEHIRQFDWCESSDSDTHFIKPEDFDRSVTERILRNKFQDPYLSSDSDGERPPINWDKVFNTKQGEKKRRLFIPGIRNLPPFPKLSAISKEKHYQCLKVLCHNDPHILELESIGPPTEQDYEAFEEIKEIYKEEQKEFKEWAKTLWTNFHCTRALRPNRILNDIYRYKFRKSANEYMSYPSNYNMAAQIPLKTTEICDMTPLMSLISVNIKGLPEIKCPVLTKRITTIRKIPMSAPCPKHPTKFILPNEKSQTELPLKEVQRSLAQYAVDNRAHYIASEHALQSLNKEDHTWQIPISVFEMAGADGVVKNIVVLGSALSSSSESVLARTYIAYKYLLENTLVSVEQQKIVREKYLETIKTNAAPVYHNSTEDSDSESSEDGAGLYIDDNEMQTIANSSGSSKSSKSKISPKKKTASDNAIDQLCTCQRGVYFDRIAARSYRKWRVKSEKEDDYYDLIAHCGHRVRDGNDEVILEPVPEYQLELGASEIPPDRLRSLLVSLLLRDSASLLTVRLDGGSGDIVQFEKSSREQLLREHGQLVSDVYNRIYSICSQLQGLRPGYYFLKHEYTHGVNAMLYVWNNVGNDLVLDFKPFVQCEANEVKYLKTPPVLTPILLPVHKFRKILPCAFSPIENHVKPPRPKPSEKIVKRVKPKKKKAKKKKK